MILPCKHEEQVTKQVQPTINLLTNVDEKTFLKRVESKNDWCRLIWSVYQVVVGITGASDSQVLSIDPWDNCPFEVAKEEGLYCNECEFWGQEVRGIDWAEFSLCCFKDKP